MLTPRFLGRAIASRIRDPIEASAFGQKQTLGKGQINRMAGGVRASLGSPNLGKNENY
jgi:hypothetical protein